MMKEGTGADPFAEDDDPQPTEEQADTTTDESDDETTMSQQATTQQEKRSLPYKYERDSVNEGREQQPVFLRPDTAARIDELLAAVEDDLGEDVYLSDVKEAAIEVAEENPKLVAEKLRSERYGYDWG